MPGQKQNIRAQSTTGVVQIGGMLMLSAIVSGHPCTSGQPEVGAPDVILRRVFEQLEAAPAEPQVTMVHWRLLRNEILRWTREQSMPTEDTFEDWAFGGEPGEKLFRDQLTRGLDLKLETLDRLFALTESQRRKLRLAALGDLKHLLDRVDESRRAFDRACADIRHLPELQVQLRAVEWRVSDGPFEAGSILLKTLHRMADAHELRPRPGSGGPPSHATP